jgi:rod shape determining protein RodA
MSAGAFPAGRDLPGGSWLGRRLGVLLHLDWLLVLTVMALSIAGIVALSGAVAGIPALASTARKQAFFLVAAVAAAAVVCLIDYRWLNRFAMGLYVANIAALIGVLLIGKTINGARSWIDLGPMNWQPSETMKVATMLVAAQWLALHPEKLEGLGGIIAPAMICGVPALLILAQPDLGTAALFFVLFIVMTMMAGASHKPIALVLGAAVAGLAAAYPFLKPYQKARLLVFLNPEADPLGAGYNVMQSRIAIGNGGLFGRGWGAGTQAIHQFLPEHHTDFVFASLVEQFGLVGGLLLLAGYGIMFWRLFAAMQAARDRFGGIVVAGCMGLLAGHVVENVGMTMGLLPVTGIPLPFVSYGGSFLITVFVIIGLVLNVGSRRFQFVGL